MVERKTLNLVVAGSSPAVGSTQAKASELGLVGYDDCFTRSRSRVRFSELVYWQMVEWPSGLRRQVKALVSSEAWVQIPLQPLNKVV